MITLIRMPPLSETMEAGRIVKWHKDEGGTVHTGEILFEVETDKVTVVVEAAADGVLRRIAVADGEIAPVGAVLGVLADPDEDISHLAWNAG